MQLNKDADLLDPQYYNAETGELDLSLKDITDDDITIILAFLKAHTEIKRLNLRGNPEISNKGFKALAANKTLKGCHSPCC
jgi:hypothetical protein